LRDDWTIMMSEVPKMRNRVGYVAVGVFPILFAVTLFGQTSHMSVTGFLTDTLSGKRGANALHVEATKRAVASGMAQYAIYDEKTHKLYILAPQSSAVAFLGEHIKVTGTLAPSPMTHGAQTVDPNTNEVKDLHHVGQDTATPVAGVLTIASIAAAPFPARATPPAPKSGQ
jgi:hypothetical protein